jgi:hypothetical protein
VSDNIHTNLFTNELIDSEVIGKRQTHRYDKIRTFEAPVITMQQNLQFSCSIVLKLNEKEKWRHLIDTCVQVKAKENRKSSRCSYFWNTEVVGGS